MLELLAVDDDAFDVSPRHGPVRAFSLHPLREGRQTVLERLLSPPALIVRRVRRPMATAAPAACQRWVGVVGRRSSRV